MNNLFEEAKKIATINTSVIVRLDIQFNYTKQSYSARIWLTNGKVFDIYEED